MTNALKVELKKNIQTIQPTKIEIKRQLPPKHEAKIL